MPRIIRTLLLCSIVFSLPALAEEVTVTRVVDGDTLVVTANGQDEKVRLIGIDAPEGNQPFGDQATKRLIELCDGKPATLERNGKDRYQRTLGDIHCGGVWVNERLVLDGSAWMYRKYSSDQRLDAAEAKARDAGAGLWSEANRMPPWEWRHR